MNALKLGALGLGVVIPSTALADTDVGARVAVRSHFFGFENVDQRNGRVDRDKVIISWFSVQSHAVAAQGRVFPMDPYIYRLSDTPGPSSACEGGPGGGPQGALPPCPPSGARGCPVRQVGEPQVKPDVFLASVC